MWVSLRKGQQPRVHEGFCFCSTDLIYLISSFPSLPSPHPLRFSLHFHPHGVDCACPEASELYFNHVVASEPQLQFLVETAGWMRVCPYSAHISRPAWSTCVVRALILSGGLSSQRGVGGFIKLDRALKKSIYHTNNAAMREQLCKSAYLYEHSFGVIS